MAVFQIPLLNTPQKFNITLNETEYTIVNKWNDLEDGGWLLDIYDFNSSEPIVMAVPLVTGVNLLEQLEYLGIPGKLFIYTDSDPLAPPTLNNLGIESNLYFVNED